MSEHSRSIQLPICHNLLHVRTVPTLPDEAARALQLRANSPRQARGEQENPQEAIETLKPAAV